MEPTRTVVITGASSGFGRGTALRLAANGFNLVLAARRGQALEALAEACGDAIAVVTEVGNPDDVEKLAKAAIAKFNRIDVWINNAGVAALGRFDDIPLRDHQRVLQTNLGGVVNGSHVALRHFRQLQSGTLINIASMLGRTPSPYYASYCASKYGVLGLSDALRQELRAHGEEGIHICTILPMAADTPFYEHAANYTGHTLHPFPIIDAEAVIDAIVAAVDAPRDEITVGLPATAAVLSERLAPGLVHRVTGVVSHQLQMETAEPAAHAPGSLHAPVAIGTGVHGDIRAQLEAEAQRSRR
ncbi:SDR family NAD(P)-dependent oxidoreductase [Luteimonas suaedae]|uniref:SDR family NAD(P)-dependent oxidoreductase n=1 Tax=Luteimonas suaedae TaxID=2605430 RepID=UPI0011F08043|nr:SDR family NAD(P)-dependent oxidoreductase [Luteimonas suaedae]